MTYEQYVISCKKFAAWSAKYSEGFLPHQYFALTTETGFAKESSGEFRAHVRAYKNNCNISRFGFNITFNEPVYFALCVGWACGLSDDQIDDLAPRAYANEVVRLWEKAVVAHIPTGEQMEIIGDTFSFDPRVGGPVPMCR